MLLKYFKHYRYLLIHKWYVFIECYKLGIIWRGVVHDYDKLIFPSVFIPYANATFGENRSINYGLKDGFLDLSPDKKEERDFFYAVFKHQRTNSHHWQSYLFVDFSGKVYPVEMEIEDLYEMMSDWKSANKMHKDSPSCFDWYQKNKEKLILHPRTRDRIEKILRQKI